MKRVFITRPGRNKPTCTEKSSSNTFSHYCSALVRLMVFFFSLFHSDQWISVVTQRGFTEGMSWHHMEDNKELSLLHLKEYISSWKHRISLNWRKYFYFVPHSLCKHIPGRNLSNNLTYLKSCSKPKWYNHVSVQLGPHIKYWHDEWNHQQLQR